MVAFMTRIHFYKGEEWVSKYELMVIKPPTGKYSWNYNH